MMRCPWATTDAMIAYHDREWGVPLHDDDRLFEMLTLEGAQAGLSWETILRKREGYRRRFYDFAIARVARMTPAAVERALTDPAIVRNRLKVASTVANARAVLAVQREFGSFDRFLWGFVDGAPVDRRPRSMREVPPASALSRTIAGELRRRGFRFVGPTVVYSFMQATGMVNDHLIGCASRGRRRT